MILARLQEGNNTVEKLAKCMNISIEELIAKLGLLEIEGIISVDSELIRIIK